MRSLECLTKGATTEKGEMRVMENVTVEVKGEKLVLTVDLTKNLGASKSGKTTVIGSTKGNQPVPGKAGMFVGLNVYKSR